MLCLSKSIKAYKVEIYVTKKPLWSKGILGFQFKKVFCDAANTSGNK